MTSKKAKSPSPGPDVETTKGNAFKWVIVGFVVLALIVFANYMFVKRVEQPKTSNDISVDEPAATTNSNGSTEAISTQTVPPPMVQADDLPQKIIGNWKITKRLVGGFPASGSGKFGTGAWLFYDDGSLKYTTGQYADLGTWKLENANFSVSLYALGKLAGHISTIDGKSMIWVTNEVINGEQVAVSNHLERFK